MNARQKAKKLKKELEFFKSRTIKPTVIREEHKIITLVGRREYSYEAMKYAVVNNNKDIIIRDVLHDIATSPLFRDMVEIYSHVDEISGKGVVKYEVRMVDPHGGRFN